MSPEPLSGSLLTAEVKLKASAPDSESERFTDVFTGMSVWSGGHSTFGIAVQETLGAVLSMLIPLTVAEAEFPATSLHVAVVD